jgi:sporulation related protein
MATPINAPMAGEIWHLSIEDLFQPVQEAPRLGGDGPFVINLSVSTAPINVPTKAFTNSPLDALVYQIQVTEDGRTRYRLRLGPFASEDEADAILAEVRDTYPGALTATASASDLRVIATMQAKADSRPSLQRQADLVVEKSVSQKIAAEKAAPEVPVNVVPQTATQTAAPQTAVTQTTKQHTAKPQTTTPEKVVPLKAAVPEGAVSARTEVPEISIDIAWPTPELGVPPSVPLRAAPATPPPAAIKSEPPPVAAPVSTKPQWSLPELDVLLPTIQKPPAAPLASVAPIAKKAAAPAPVPVPFELQLAPPYSIASLAPVLTEVVTPTRSPAPPKNVAPKPAVIAAPVLTEAVAPKIKAPPPVAAAAPAPVAATTAAGPLQAPATPEMAPPSKQEMAPPPKKATAPPPKQIMAPSPKPEAPPQKAEAPPPKAEAPPKPAVSPKPAAPQSLAPAEPAKTAPVLKQSVATPRRSWAKFRNSISKPAASKLTSLQHVVVATAPVPAAREVKKLDEPLESLESTQTIRALTPKELEDNEASRWFVIQLALADHAFDPDAVPNLDIFSEYRLYSVAGLDQGRVVHALRLGFFREEIGAVAVASYLAAYWDKPTIKRVSLAERERFADQRVEARKDIGATGKHAVIEITDELVARRRRSTKTSAASKASNRPI